MSIKVTIGESKTQSDKPFPKLMQSKETGIIVLMTRHASGTVVNKNEHWHIGYASSGWNMDVFCDYNEPITLQND